MPVQSRTAELLAGPARVALGKATAGLMLAFLVAFPLRTLLQSNEVPVALKLVWVALLAVGFRLPGWSGVIVLVTVPLLPIWPYEFALPHGIVHLVVASQAVPYLLRRLRTPLPEQDPISSLWALFIAIGIASSIVVFAGFPAAFPSTQVFLAQVFQYLSGYMFNRIGPGIPNTIVAATTLVDGWLAYAMMREAAESGHRKRLVIALAATPVLVASLGLIQSVTLHWLRSVWRFHDPGLVRINSTYSDPNALAAYFALTLPLLVAVALGSAQHRARWPALAGSALVIWALVLTAGRAGYAGAAAGLAALMWQINSRRLDQRAPWPRVLRRRFRTLMLAGAVVSAAALLLLTVLGTVWNVTHAAQTSYMDTVLYTLNLRLPLDERVKGRLALWRAAWLMIRDSPGFGIGLGVFFSAFPKYNAMLRNPFSTELRMSAHNTFLGIWAELGALGLAVFASLLGVALWVSFQKTDRFAARDSARTRELTPWIRAGLAAGLLAYLSTMVTGDRTILREDVVMLGAWMGLAASFATPPLQLRTAVGRGVAVVLAAVLLTLPFRVEAGRRQVPLDRLTWGFHGWESADDTPFRWTQGTALFYVSSKGTSVAVPIRSLAPFPQSVTVLLDDVPVDSIALTDHAWHVRRYALNRRFARGGYHRFELRVRPVWTPANDDRTFGVMVGELSVTE